MKVLKDPTRRRLIRLLAEEGPLEYSEILRRLNLKYTGRLNYHLKVLREYVGKDENNRYYLNERGRRLYEVMLNFKTWRQTRFTMRSMVILTFLLMVFSLTLTFYSSGEHYYEILVVGRSIGKSIFVTSLAVMLILVLVGASPSPEPSRPTITGLLEVNVPSIVAILVIVLVGVTLTVTSWAIELGDLLLWSFILIPPALSWLFTVERYGLTVKAILLSSAVLFSLGLTITFAATFILYGPSPTLRGMDEMFMFHLAHVLVEVLMIGVKQAIQARWD